MLTALLALQIAVIVCLLWLVNRSGILSLFTMSSLYFLLIFPLRGIFVQHVNYGPVVPYKIIHSYELYTIMTILFSTIGYISFLLAYIAGSKNRYITWTRHFENRQRYSDNRLRILCYCLLLLSSIFIISEYTKIGSISDFFLGMGDRVSETPKLIVSVISTNLLAFVIIMLIRKAKFIDRLCFFILAINLVLAALLVGSKGMLLNPLLVYIVYKFVVQKRKFSFFWFSIFCLIIGSTFIIMNILRGDAVNYLADQGFISLFSVGAAPGALLLILFDRFHAFDALFVSIVKFGDEYSSLLGEYYFKMFVGVIPRVLWENKPVTNYGGIFADTYFAEYIGGLGISPALSILTEGYVNFHLLGICMSGALYGFFLGNFEKRYGTNSRNFANIPYFYMLLYVITLWESSLSGAFPILLQSLITAVLLHKLAITKKETTL